MVEWYAVIRHCIRDIWSALKESLQVAWTYFQGFPDWTEKHSGLGTWVGAAGAILAILAAWGLARAEYNRVQRTAAERFNREIALYMRVTSEFLSFVEQYVRLAKEQDPSADGFESAHSNDGVYRRTADLNWMPITQWPSVEAYDAFKDFFLVGTQLLRTPASSDTRARFDSLENRLLTTFDALQKALAAARKRGALAKPTQLAESNPQQSSGNITPLGLF
jgi:hypothetical protein